MQLLAQLQGLDAFADAFWKAWAQEKIFLFYGGMGAGKTTLIEALCKARGVQDHMGSPTFSIINEYRSGAEIFYHMDLYRLKDEEEALHAGVDDCLHSGAVCFVEWPQRAPKLFEGLNVVKLFMEATSEKERVISMEKSHA